MKIISAELLTCIKNYIDGHDGAHVSPISIQREFSIGADWVAFHMLELERLGHVSVHVTRVRTYTKVIHEEKGAPPELAAVFRAPPLKVDKHRRELYADLANARAAIPSIG